MAIRSLKCKLKVFRGKERPDDGLRQAKISRQKFVLYSSV